MNKKNLKFKKQKMKNEKVVREWMGIIAHVILILWSITWDLKPLILDQKSCMGLIKSWRPNSLVNTKTIWAFLDPHSAKNQDKAQHKKVDSTMNAV